jgi:hypothetical protein
MPQESQLAKAVRQHFLEQQSVEGLALQFDLLGCQWKVPVR